MNRREMLGSVAALTTAAIYQKDDIPSDIPVIEFHSSNEISNIDELFDGVEWLETFRYRDAVVGHQRKKICWLPKDRAVECRVYCAHPGQVYFYGLVQIWQNKHIRAPYLKMDDYLGLPVLERTAESIIEIRQHEGCFMLINDLTTEEAEKVGVKPYRFDHDNR